MYAVSLCRGSIKREMKKNLSQIRKGRSLMGLSLESFLLKSYFPPLVVATFVLLLGSFIPHFLSMRNFTNILAQTSALGLMAVGVSFTMITGGIDLSVPSVMALGGIFGAMFMRAGGSPIIGVLVMLVMGSALGSLNGLAVAYLGLIPFVVTLSMMYITTGASVWLTREISVSGLPTSFVKAFTMKVFGLPVSVFIWLIATFVVFEIIRRSQYGRWMYAVGSSPSVAKLFGIPVQRVIFRAYVLSGFFAGLAAVIATARLASASSKMGSEGVILNVIGAAVVGGVSIHGAEGSVLGASIGAIFIVMLENMMNMMRVSYYMSLLAKGILIIVIVAFDCWRKERIQGKGWRKR